MNNVNTKDFLIRAYQILEFTPEESQKAVADLSSLQVIAIITELTKILTQEETRELNSEAANATGEEKQDIANRLLEKYKDDKIFQEKIKAAENKVMIDHIAYLKTRGDDRQKEEIAKILAGIE